MKKPYNKAPLSFQDQLNLMKSRGLVVGNEQRALSYLQEISYYRLSAYFLPYQKIKDQFDKGTTFEKIIDTYSFDRELRLLVFDCIERVEVAIRTQMIYQMALFHNDSHWHDNKTHFVTPYYNKIGNLVDPYSDFQTIIFKAKTARTPETFIKHYMNEYRVPANPPSWMCFELLTIGELSHLYRGLNNNADKKRIADFFDLHPTVFTSWLHTLTYVRNFCAHHSRLWNRDFAIEPDKLQKPKGIWIAKEFENNKRLFYFLCALRYMLLRVNPENDLRHKLIDLFTKYPTVPIQYIGIPSDGKGNMLDWQHEPFWKQ
jgi:abortive infection bacteriophage resistance protein